MDIRLNQFHNTRLAIVYRDPSSLITNPGNPRHHSKRQIEKISKSIATFGFLIPVLIDRQGNIIAGHARVQAAELLELNEIPTISVDHLTQTQVKAFMIADNRLSELSVWNEELLSGLLKELSVAVDLDFDLQDIGFTHNEIELRIESLDSDAACRPDPDDQLTDTAGEPPVCCNGDLFILGQHRVMQGDATSIANIEKLMNGQRAAMTTIDPPYGVNYGHSAKDNIRGTTHRPILNDNLGDEFGSFLEQVCINILSVTDGGIYICMSSSALHTLYNAFVKAGGHWSTFIIWAKQTFTIGRADYQRQYEPILYGWRKGVDRYWCGDRDQGDVWFINKPVKNDLHPTMKPVELIMRTIGNSSRRGEIILDTFLGSGTTLIAAERTGRICYGMELDPRYVDTIIRRWQQHTGENAVHAASGRTFNDMAEKGV